MVTKLSKKSYFLLGLLLVFSLLPIALGGHSPIIHVLILCLIWSVMAAAWDLLMGYASVFCFGQFVFLGIGGYTSAALALYLGISPWLGILAGGALAGATGFLMGLPCLRLRGIYVGIVTFSVQLVLPVVLVATHTFGGSYGLVGIPPLYVGGYTFSRLELLPWYYVALGISSLLLFAIYKIINSSIGLAFMSLRDSDSFAKSLGVNEYRTTLVAFGISAFITGIIGGFYVHYIGLISPSLFGLSYFLLVFTMIVIGGMARFPGAIIGAFVITFVNNALIPLGSLRLVILGAIVVAVMIVLPQGLIGIPETVNRLIRRTSKKRIGGERI